MTVFLALGGVGLVVVLLGLVAGEVFDVLDAGPEWLSPLTVGTALAAFGFAGAIALSLTDGNLTAGVVYGAAGAVGVAFAAWRVTRILSRDHVDPAITSSALLGSYATVVDDIPAEGHGTVTTTVAGSITRLNARAASPLPRGAALIVDVLSPTSVLVEPLAEPRADPAADPLAGPR